MPHMKSKIVATSFAMIGIGVVIASIVYLRRKSVPKCISNTKSVKTLIFPLILIGSVVGKGGRLLDAIRRTTSTNIKVLIKDTESASAVITGTPQNVEEAESLLLDVISKKSDILFSTEELEITPEQWKSIIGDTDMKIRHICELSKAQLSITWNNAYSMPKFVLKGNQHHINAASSLIKELVAAELASADDDDKTRTQDHIVKKPQNICIENTECNYTDVPHEKLSADYTSDGYVDIFVSVVANPSQFWVQLVGKKSVELDKINEDMTEFYNNEYNRSKYRVQSAQVGKLVAANFTKDKAWYRARILSTVSKDNGTTTAKVEVFYVDFGDCDTVEQNMVCNLIPDYLSLPIQGIECCLADVEPVDGTWSNKAIKLFENKTYAAEWKVIIAKPMPILPITGPKTNIDIVPVILIDTNNDKDINISDELVKSGCAKRQQKPLQIS